MYINNTNTNNDDNNNNNGRARMKTYSQNIVHDQSVHSNYNVCLVFKIK